MESKDDFIRAIEAVLQAYCAHTSSCKWCEVRNYCPSGSEWQRTIKRELGLKEDDNG